ncbi:hypothetical protein [Prochlorococcus sp. MIT 1300]|uniref:hypothetical protein n=1 Tax=Prochlorococcus sp. MIT 1300 TaxID=3096218 RepID=UPI002A762444|nr:hypothetical protein [Prochlorococcus sp. MIT 1300]
MINQIIPLIPFVKEELLHCSVIASYFWKEGCFIELSYLVSLDDWEQSILLDSDNYESTSFEIFFSIPESTAYWQHSFNYNGSYSLHYFSDYRKGKQKLANIKSQLVDFSMAKDHFRLTISIDPKGWLPDSSPLEISIATILDIKDKGLSYWSNHHNENKVDFHSRANFFTP